MQTLTNVYNRLTKVITANFDKLLIIEAVVKTVNVGSFIIIDRDWTLKCSTSQDLTSLRENDPVQVKGYLKFCRNEGIMYIKVVNFDVVNEPSHLSKTLELLLLQPKCQQIIMKLHSRPDPTYIINVGLISIQPTIDLEHFKVSFQEQCTGTLNIYHLQDCNIQAALDYFTTVPVDLLCILATQLIDTIINRLQTRDIVKFLLNRKNYPYLVTISNYLTPNNNESLISMLSNRSFTTIPSCIDYIKLTQLILRKQLDANISASLEQLQLIIEDRRQQLANLKQYTSDADITTVKEILHTKYLKVLTDEEIATLNHLITTIESRIVTTNLEII